MPQRKPFALIVTLAAASVTLLIAATTSQKHKLWSLNPVQVQAPPQVKDGVWIQTPIDRFILAKLEARGLHPNPKADKIALIRRAYLDLTGLPPEPAAVDAFLADPSPDAFTKVVDTLLASPHYGERWGRHWLDLARYAESEGFKADETRPNAWRYRDYVIQSFNHDKPYDRFVQEQIAGDELWPNDPQALVATAFNRHYPDESNARQLQQRRQEILDDMTDTTASVFLGLTYGCARCHDHKFDPILQADYYRLQAFFANTAANDHIAMLTGAQLNDYRAKRAVWEEKTKSIRAAMTELIDPVRKKASQDYFEKYPPEIQAMILKPAAQRTPYEEQMAYKAKPYLETPDESPDPAKSLKGAAKVKYEALQKELAQFDGIKPPEFPEGIGLHDLGASAPPTHILSGGTWDNAKAEVQPGFLTALDPGNAKVEPPAGLASTGRRTALAHWLTNPGTNPLAARVIVNRIWTYHFGKGLMSNPSDFGNMGGRPTHPELLDYLAAEFVRSGWSMKKMHRLILLSSVYQQSTAYQSAAAAEDEGNKLLWSFPLTRLEGEAIRDSALAVSGLLNPAVGGPSVFPELPAGMAAPRGGWKTSAQPEARNRRSVYIFVRRNTRYPMLEAYDMPDTHESCPRRMTTTTAPQALALINDRNSLAWAQAFAARIKTEPDPVDAAFRLAYSRHADPWEKDEVATFLHKQKALIAQRAARGEKIAASSEDEAALVDFCQMLLSSNEFAYRN